MSSSRNASVIDRRQFVLSHQRYDAPNFHSIEIEKGYVLSYHEDLPVRVENGNVLIGYAFSCKAQEVRLANAPEEEMKYWSGRWVLITGGKLFLDACGTLGCFFAIERDGSAVLSSSLRLMAEVYGGEWIADHELVRGEYHGLFDYYPIPFTPLRGVKSLLPSQYFDLASVEVKNRSDFNFERYKAEDRAKVEGAFIDGMTMVMRNIDRQFDHHVWLTLTGGVDSRTNLALAYRAGIPLHVYTADRDDIAPWDYRLPIRICRKLGIAHHVLPCRNRDIQDSGRMDDVLRQCGGKTTVGTEVTQYLCDADVPEAEKSVVLWGTVWEVAKKYYYPYFAECQKEEDICKEYERVCGDIFEESLIHNLSLHEWLKTVRENPVDGFDWRERQYWEQRVGAWGRYAYQVLDMLDSVRISPVNSQYLLELLTSLNHQESMTNQMALDKVLQKEIIRLCCPQIADIPYGEPTSLFYRARRKGMRIARRLVTDITNRIQKGK